jgi:hypothetical protein
MIEENSCEQFSRHQEIAPFSPLKPIWGPIRLFFIANNTRFWQSLICDIQFGFKNFFKLGLQNKWAMVPH